MTNATALRSSTAVFVPSPQQQVIFDWVLGGKGSAFIEAVAGAGKTTTLIQLCKLLKGSVIFVAFNKKIVEEIKSRLQAIGLTNIEAATFHSVGFKALRSVYKYVKVDGRAKNQRLIQEVGIPERFQTFVFSAVGHAKNRAIGEAEIANTKLWWDIIDHFDLTEELEESHEADEAVRIAQETLRHSIKISNEIIDFDDMIYLPVIRGMKVWAYDNVLIDEAQDTNEARRQLARKLLKEGGRSMWVGDRHQSIYGFTGADADAVETIIKEFNCTCLPLTVTYRCPKAVVAMARTVPLAWQTVLDQRTATKTDLGIQAHESAPDGVVRTIDEGDLLNQSLVSSDAILCRKTKPLVELAFRLIRKSIACHVEGRDIGQGLLKLATRWKVKSVPALITKLEEYKEREVAKLIAKGRETQAEALADRVDTVIVLADGCDTLDCIRNKINSLFQDAEGERRPTLTLCTEHRSKGREWDRVFILGYHQWQPSKFARQAWQIVQEHNLQYVAITRAKKELVIVNVDVPKKEGVA